MKIEVHVQSIDDVPAARAGAEAIAEEGDEIVVIVDAPATAPVERQPMVQARAPR